VLLRPVLATAGCILGTASPFDRQISYFLGCKAVRGSGLEPLVSRE
jgi:hypothetical protein